MILTIEFENSQQEKFSFDWELLDASYATRWAKLMLEWRDLWRDGVPEFKDKWFISSNEDDFCAYIEKIKLLVDKIDKIGEHHIGSANINLDITREELNRIHEEFHKYVELSSNKKRKSKKVKETEELCHQLNDLVHLTEIAEKNRHESNPDKRIIATAIPHMQVEYEDADYDAFTSTMCKGWIYIGYATPGKSLFHCFSDNDMAVVEHGMVRQSQGLSNEIHIELNGEDAIDPLIEEKTKTQYYTWCEENNIKNYGFDYTNPIYNPGRIPLAKPISNVDDLLKFFNSTQGKITNLYFKITKLSDITVWM